MHQFLPWIFTGLGAYVLGSVPFGFFISKSRGVDIRTVGSGNIGATNVFRSVGALPGIVTFALDLGKGFCAAWFLAPLIIRAFGADTPELPLRVMAGVCAVAGHNWTCFLGFKGGKGVATSLGFLLGVVWLGALLAFGVWLVVLLATRYVSLASITAAAALGVSVWFLYPLDPAWFRGVVTALAFLAVIKHHANIRRLLSGTENRMRFSKRKES